MKLSRAVSKAAVAATVVIAVVSACAGNAPDDDLSGRPPGGASNSSGSWKQFVEPSAASGCPSAACSDILAQLQKGVSTRTVPADLAPSLQDASNDLVGPEGGNCSSLPVSDLDGAFQPCIFDAGVPPSAPLMILIGNSHALMWSQALQSVASQLGYRFGLVQHEGCTMPRVQNPTHTGSVSAAACKAWQDAATNWANQQNPNVVVVASGTNLSSQVTATELPAGYAATLKEFQGPGRQIFVIGDGPGFAQSPPVCLAANSMSALKCASPASSAIAGDEQQADLDAAKQAGANYVNIIPWLCTADTCPAIVGNYLAYRDQSHLTTTFTKSLVPVLKEALKIGHA